MNVRLYAAGAAFALAVAAFALIVNGRAIGNPNAFVVTSCSSTAACDGGTNSSTGQGVKGTSTSGYGVYGTSTKSYGVLGYTTSGAAGVLGESNTGFGVYGSGLTNGTGLRGLGINGLGVNAQSTNNYALDATSTNATAIVGVSSASIGVYGQTSGTEPAMWAVGGTGDGIDSEAFGGVGVYSISESSSPAVYAYGSSGDALEARTAGGIGAYVVNSNGNGIDDQGSYIGIVARAPASGGFPIVATDQNANNLFYVDGAGNVYYRGSLTSFIRTAAGTDVHAYEAKDTAPTIEESGTARLTNGSTIVYLDAAFAQAIDPSRGYEVIVTPGGESRGLFVASKHTRGFVVRENMGGRGSVSFDYHVYATPLNAQAALANAVPNAPRVIRAVPQQKHPVMHVPHPNAGGN